MAFLSAQELTFQKEEVAVAITYGTFGSHTGIAFHSAKEGMQLLHLQSHKLLTAESYPPKHCWIVNPVALPPAASKQLVGVVRAVAKRQPSIGYGIDAIAAKGSFDTNGHYRPPKGSKGLTCATFVSEIFNIFNLPLIDENTWEKSDQNIQWGNGVCAFLKEQGVDQDHIDAVRGTINGLRVRPEEIGAASLLPYKNRPAAYQVALAGADEVMQTLHEKCPLKPKFAEPSPPAIMAQAEAPPQVNNTPT